MGVGRQRSLPWWPQGPRDSFAVLGSKFGPHSGRTWSPRPHQKNTLVGKGKPRPGHPATASSSQLGVPGRAAERAPPENTLGWSGDCGLGKPQHNTLIGSATSRPLCESSCQGSNQQPRCEHVPRLNHVSLCDSHICAERLSCPPGAHLAVGSPCLTPPG